MYIIAGLGLGTVSTCDKLLAAFLALQQKVKCVHSAEHCCVDGSGARYAAKVRHHFIP